MASLLLSLIAAIVFIFSPTTHSLPDPPPASWKLALYWPNSYCLTKGIKCSPSIPQNAFVIRTLIAVDQFDQEITCLEPHPPLDPSKITEVQNLLSQYWPDLEGDNFGRWQKEWQTYAACYGMEPSFYFLGAIGLKIDIDRQIVNKGFGGSGFPGEQVFGALSRQGVVPGNTYYFTTYADKVSSKYGEALEVVCNEDTAQVSQLLEFHMCAKALTYKFALIPCAIQKTGECLKNVRFT